ncbi:NAD(P)-binding protein [Rhizoclosmatium globosum]|uniref:NAD(P)-binding protein n=1 Tax=Rhizoclosmatium globosum TaxID=329046 RepID=A0A1Y2CAY4_9FUNG|nr:NAD(P)-binding protein [Rhizoclosmatium globosum]|eukprot:ORY44047.1 NAD(P)-binding protein [Rhizoclosmatium globosum]
MIVAVLGASGELGTLVVEALLTKTNVNTVRAVVRKSTEQLNALKASHDRRLDIAIVDYDSPASLDIALAGVYSAVSTLQGMRPVLIDLQSKLLSACIKNNVKRFIPSDFAYDFISVAKLNYAETPRGYNHFHEAAKAIIASSGKSIEFIPISIGMFMDLFPTDTFQIMDWNKKYVGYFGDEDTKQEFTTYRNTAEFTARVLTDPKPITKTHFHIAGHQASPKELAALISEATGETFVAHQALSLPFAGMDVIWGNGWSAWPKEKLDNDYYGPVIEWTQVQDVVKTEYELRKKGLAGKDKFKN